MREMTLNEYQEQANQFAIYPGSDIPDGYEYAPPAIYPFLGLAEESGEVMGKLAKVFRGDTEVFDQEAMCKELGDVLWQLSECCRQVGLNLDTVAKHNIDKLISRKNRGTIKGSGDYR